MAAATTNKREPRLSTQPIRHDTFIPNFCAIHMVFAVVVVAQLFALVLALAGFTRSVEFWGRLGLISLFVQWVALSSAALLCLWRPVFMRLRDRYTAIAAYAIILLITLLFSEAAYWLALNMPALAGDPARHEVFLIRNMAISAVAGALALHYFYLQYQWKNQLRLESRARLDALQSRIRPHFLFNSLNVIASLTRSEPSRAEAAVEDLADLFRYNLYEAGSLIPFSEELEICRRYLDIESLRLGERLRVEWRLADLPPEARIPPLTLQPLVENAVYHGIETSTEGGDIRIEADCAHGMLQLTVSNTLGEGAPPRYGHHMAQDNIRERLAGLYQGRARMHTEMRTEQHERAYLVSLSIPLEPSLEQDES